MESTETELKFLYLAFDLIILNIAIGIVIAMSPMFWSIDILNRSLYLLHANMCGAITYLVFSSNNLYLHDDFSNRVKRISKSIIMFILFSFVFAQIFLPSNYSKLFILEYSMVFYIGKIIFYLLLYRYLKYGRSKGYFVHRVLIMGLNEMGVLLREVMDGNPMLGFDFIGYISEREDENKDVLGHLDDLIPIVTENEVEMIFVTLPLYNDIKKSKELLAICNKVGIRLRIVPENQYWFKSKLNLESVGTLVVFNPQEIPLDDVKSRFLKRIFDVFFSSVVIFFILSWLFPILFLLIKLSSKGPVFFFQKRTGINNKTFNCIKFRSMCMSDDADEKQATKGDSRVTKIGHFLRKSNLDEFPQFFNVLIGQMSIVGPRPHMLKHTNQYSELIDYYRVRHYVKPGITGWAQVNGYRGETDELWKMQKRVEYDMKYLENWTFTWDLRIIFLTIFSKNTYKNAL